MRSGRGVLSILAHPDDAEFLCGGTLALLKQNGWEVHIATMTAGDCGSAELGKEEISKIRRGEAKAAAEFVEGTYHCLECEDVFIMYDRETLLKVIRLLRQVRPAVVFAPSPQDYMIDHEMTSLLAQTACFSCGMPNIVIEGVEAFEPTPYLYYVDAAEGKDKLGNELKAGMVVDVSSVIDTKEKMLCCHESQRSWLRAHHGMDEYVESMKRFGQQRGKVVSADFAEGFCQHLGHGYPGDNILKAELGELVHELR